MWVKDETCRKVVDESWKGGSDKSFIDLAGSVKICRHSLAKWNKKVYRNLQNQIKQKRLELERLHTKVKCPDDNVVIKDCKQ